MKNYIIIIGFLLYAHTSILAQADNSREVMKKIRERCEKINRDINNFQNSEDKMYEYIRVNEVSIDKYKSQNHPALGEKNSTITFYYYTGGHDFNDGDDLLIKIERVNNIAAHQEYYEYYFNVDNHLIFYFEAPAYAENDEFRFYFNNEQLIEYRVNSQVYKQNDLTKSHFSKASLIQKESKKSYW